MSASMTLLDFTVGGLVLYTAAFPPTLIHWQLSLTKRLSIFTMGVKKYAFERGSGDFPTKDDLVKVKFSCFLYDDTNQKDCYKGDR